MRRKEFWNTTDELSPETGNLYVPAAMNHLLGSSITYRIAVGPQRGRKVFTLQTLPDCTELGGTVSFAPSLEISLK